MSIYKSILTAEELVELMEEKADDAIEDDIFDEIEAMSWCNAKWERYFPYKEYDIYLPIFEDGKPNTELMVAIAVKVKEARLLTREETEEYMNRYKGFMR